MEDRASPPSGPSAAREHRYPRGFRIRKGDEIRALLRAGRRKKTSHLDVFFTSGGEGFSRFGVVVPKHRRTVVTRNVLRRRLKELGRVELLPALRRHGKAVDVLVRARKEAYDARFKDLRDEMREVADALCSDRWS